MLEFVETPLGDLKLLCAFNGNRLHDVLLMGDGREDIGAIYLARVERPVKGIGGVFVTYEGKKKGFWRVKNPPREGAVVPLQIVQTAIDDKPPRFSERLDFRGRLIVLTPERAGINASRSWKRKPDEYLLQEIKKRLPDGAGAILRTDAQYADPDEILAELDGHLTVYQSVLKAKEIGLIQPSPVGQERAEQEWGALQNLPTLRDDHKDALYDALHLPRLSRGGTVQIETTRALIAVDIDTGANTAPTAGRDVNMGAAEETMRWLGLMGWGGQLVIDPAPMPQNLRKNFENALIKAAKSNGVSFIARGFGPLGLFEGQIRYDRRALPVDILTKLF